MAMDDTQLIRLLELHIERQSVAQRTRMLNNLMSILGMALQPILDHPLKAW